MLPMALSLESQWTVVACGVMAHADGVLDGEECDLLLAMVEGEADAEEYSAWLSTISDRPRLEEMLTQLTAPPEPTHREILETAWTVAVVDGERTAPEEEALTRITLADLISPAAGRIVRLASLGVDTRELDTAAEQRERGS